MADDEQFCENNTSTITSDEEVNVVRTIAVRLHVTKK